MICLGNRHILIAGGGIGGLSAALAAARMGFDVTVLEKAAEFVEIGAGLQLAPNATRVLKGFGVLADVLDVGVLPDRLVLASAITGEELTTLDVRDFDEMYGGPYVVAHRGDGNPDGLLFRGCLAGAVGPMMHEPTGDPVAEFGVVGGVEDERMPSGVHRP